MGRNRPAAPAKAAAPPPPAAPKPAAAPPPARVAPPAPVGGHAAPHPPTPGHHAAPPMMPMGGGGPGLMGTMASSMVGSLAGNYIAHKMFGGAAPANPEQVQQMSQAMPPNDPCRAYFDTYGKCIEQGTGADACGWAWDLVAKCRQQNGLV